MITEKGTVKVSSQIDIGMQKELNRGSLILSIVFLVLGCVALVVGVALFVSSDYDSLNPFFYVAGILILFGIFLIVIINNTNKQATKFNKVEEVEFFRDHMIVREYTDGEHVSTSKVYYKWILRVKETKNYLFMYNTRATAVVVGKSNLPFQELSAVCNLLGKPLKGGAPAVGQPYNGSTANVNGGSNFGATGSTVTPPWGNPDMPTSGNAPVEPFADLKPQESDDGDSEDKGSNDTDGNV